jgi:hypothetical protein
VSGALGSALKPQDVRLFFGDGCYRTVEKWSPPVGGRELADEAAAALAEIRTVLRPADRGKLLARVLALLSHYRSDPNPAQVEMAMADDWADDLGEFPMWAIEEASRTWRRTKRFKPQICEMRDLCRDACAAHTERKRRLEEIVAHNHPAARRAAMVVASCVRRPP